MNGKRVDLHNMFKDPNVDTPQRLRELVNDVAIAYDQADESLLRVTPALYGALGECHRQIFPPTGQAAKVARITAQVGDHPQHYSLSVRLTPLVQAWLEDCYAYHRQLHADRVEEEGEEDSDLVEWGKALDQFEYALRHGTEVDNVPGVE